MAITNQGVDRPLSINDIFRFQPYYRELPYEKPSPSTSKGTELMDAVLLDQYQNKPLLREYFLAFIEELDLLFGSIDQVYYGRMLDRAIGVQLDAIGRIIDQGREIVIAGGDLFGLVTEDTVSFPSGPDIGEEFVDDLRTYVWTGAEWMIASSERASDIEAHNMANRSTPSDGGSFKDGWYGNFFTVPLNDIQYRGLLKAKAGLHNRHCISHNQLYIAVSTLLDRTPRHMRLIYAGSRRLTLQVSSVDVSVVEEGIIQYFVQYFVPLGTQFSIERL
jgi:hypothetical protein